MYDITKDDGTVRMKIHQIVGKLDHVGVATYCFVDDLFWHDSGLHGATGSRMCPVTEEEVDRRLEELRDPECSALRHIYDEQVSNGLDESWSSWIETQIQRDGIDLVLDPSYVGRYGETVKDKVEAETGDRPAYVECIGGGRMFGDNSYAEVYNDDLLRMIHDAESDDPEWVKPYL